MAVSINFTQDAAARAPAHDEHVYYFAGAQGRGGNGHASRGIGRSNPM